MRKHYKNAINDDGTVKIVDEVVYDTLSNGKIVARTLPGEIKKVEIDEQETYLRTNFDRSDNRNFRDGDQKSSRYYRDNFEDEDGFDTKKVYNSPRHRIDRDSATGKMIKEFDQSDRRTSLINDEARVYKRGSWKDRVYWIDPAQRRFSPQDMATDYIGFRCAVSRVGSKSKSNKKTRN